MTKTKALKEIENRYIIRSNLRFNWLQGKLRKEYEQIRIEFQEGTKYGIKISKLIYQLQEVEKFIETNFKDKYEDIFINVDHENYEEDCRTYFFDVEVGRYETDTEYYSRKKEQREREKKDHARKLKQEAEEYIKLKQKFG